MGLLKHVLLPAFGLMHASSAVACWDLKSWATTIGMKDSVSADDEKSIRQNHMLGYLRGFNLGMCILCALGTFKEHAHFRAQIVLAEFVMFSSVTIDAFRLGGLYYAIPGVQALVALGGYIINSMEPGIFTKDKNA